MEKVESSMSMNLQVNIAQVGAMKIEIGGWHLFIFNWSGEMEIEN
jgi:hypothetical protein